MHFPYTLLHIKPYINLLIPVQLDDRNANVLAPINFGGKLYGQDWLPAEVTLALVDHVDRLDVKRSDLPDRLEPVLGYVLVMHLEPELQFADLAVVDVFGRAIAFPRVLVVVYILAYEGDQANPLSQELIVQHRSVLVDANQVGGHRGDLGYQGPAQGIREADIAVVEYELDPFGANLQNFTFDSRHYLGIYYRPMLNN